MRKFSSSCCADTEIMWSVALFGSHNISKHQSFYLDLFFIKEITLGLPHNTYFEEFSSYHQNREVEHK